MRVGIRFFKIISILLLCLPRFSLAAEAFRVHKTVPVALTTLDAQVSLEAGINDALFIALPDDLTYVSGIELHFKIPEIIAAWQDTIAYSLYDGITPFPAADIIDYEGTRISVGTLPGKLSHTIYIPLSQEFALKKSPYHEKIPVIPDIQKRAVFFRMQLAMKGVPDAFETAEFVIAAKPVLVNKGKLHLVIVAPEGTQSTYAVFIDEASFTPDKNGNLLATGEHHLSVTGEDYRNEVRTFRIEQAKTTNLTVHLRSIEPTVKIVSPENAEIFFDGEPFENTKDAFVVSQGDHIVRFVIGDYEVIKTVTAVNGRSYTVNLSVDAAVIEDED